MRKYKDIGIYSVKEFADTYFESNEFGAKLKQQIPQIDSCLFFINKMEDGVKAINFPKKRLRSNYFEIFFITQSYCILDYNLQEIHQKANQIRFSSPGSFSSIKEMSKDIQGYYLSFDEDFIRLVNNIDFLPNLSFFFSDVYPVVELDGQTLAHFTNILDYLLILSNQRNNQEKDKIISAYLTAFLLECKAIFTDTLFRNTENSSSYRITKNFFNLLFQDFSYTYKLKDYAEKLNISAKYLTKSVKKTTGFPPSYFVKKTTVLEAKIMLKETQESVSEIAYILGFEDVSYFIKFFKKHSGQTPATYRLLKK